MSSHNEMESNEEREVTITKQTAFNLGVVIVIIAAAWAISARLENMSVRLEQLEKRGSEPMQAILKTVITVQSQMEMLQVAVAEVKTQLDKHMNPKGQ